MSLMAMEKDRINKLREQFSQKKGDQLSQKEKINASDYISIIGVALLMALNAKVKYVISDLDDLSDAIIMEIFFVRLGLVYKLQFSWICVSVCGISPR